MNYLYRRIIFGLAAVSICGTSYAATDIERSEMGKIQTITLDKYSTRVDNPDPNYYTVMDQQDGKVYMVNVKEKRIVKMNIIGSPPQLPRNRPQRPSRGDMSPPVWGQQDSRPSYDRSQPSWGQGPSRPPRDMSQPSWRQGARPWRDSSREGDAVQAKLINKGNGPMIAGYPTIQYQVKADSQVCSETYFSKEAGKVAYLKNFLIALSKLSKSRKIKGMQLPPCLKAHDQLEAESLKLGLPMKTIVKGGKRGDQVMYEIVSIQTNVDVSRDIFNLPVGYRMMSEQEMIREGEAKMRQWMEENKQRRPERYMPRQNWKSGDETRGSGGNESRYMMPPPRQSWGDDREQSGRPYSRPPYQDREQSDRPYRSPYQDWRNE